MARFILYDLDPSFWAKVQAKAAAEGVTVKALILRLLAAWLAVGVLLFTVGCSGGNPTAPTMTPAPKPGTTPPPATGITTSGQVTATNGQQPLSGVTVTIGSVSTQTDGAGRYSLSQPAGVPSLRISLTGNGLVPRQTLSATGDVDAITTSGGFDLTFYRQFVRNSFDAPGTLEPLRRWTHAPLIYLKTVDEAGQPIDAAQLDSTSATIQDAASQWSAGAFGVAGIERGTGTKEGVPGYLTVKWPALADTLNVCGRAQVGVEGGSISLYYHTTANCSCGPIKIRPITVRHELGHAFGYWHTDSPNDVMHGETVGGTCDQPLSARERYHAAIAYRRPVGNVDPDTDPASVGALRTLSVP